jgi:chorismate mutase
MPRKPPSRREIARLRARMDRLNLRLAALVQQRARLALAIGREKARLGLRAPDPAREREMLRAVLRGAPEGFPPAELERIFRAVFRASRDLVTHDRKRAS